METNDRRGFLRGLAALPLIGGGVTLFGEPVRAAMPITNPLLDAYAEFLFMEHRMLGIERYGVAKARIYGRGAPCNTMAGTFHDRGQFPPSTRAAVILSAAGVPLT